MIGCICILTPIAWVRDIAKFSFTFMIGNFMILFTAVVVSSYCFAQIKEQGGVGPGVQIFNQAGYLTTVGFAIYTYEGIGVIMPIMQTCATPEKFSKIMFFAIITLSIIYFAFGNLGYLTYGSSLNQPLITEMLPATDPIVITTKLIFVLSLFCSYAIVVNPTNTIIESWIFGKKSSPMSSYYARNFSRFLVCISAAILGVALSDKIDKFLGLMGAVLCAPLAITMPSMLHLRLIAKTKRERMIDIALIVISIFILVFSTSQSLVSWNDV
jgi:solute carrier family 36 (proton-coupled amino acid transporter)